MDAPVPVQRSRPTPVASRGPEGPAGPQGPEGPPGPKGDTGEVDVDSIVSQVVGEVGDLAQRIASQVASDEGLQNALIEKMAADDRFAAAEPEKIDYERLAAQLVPLIATDQRFRGRDGEHGTDAVIDYDELVRRIRTDPQIGTEAILAEAQARLKLPPLRVRNKYPDGTLTEPREVRLGVDMLILNLPGE